MIIHGFAKMYQISGFREQKQKVNDSQANCQQENNIYGISW